jgi:hypothetical protein
MESVKMLLDFEAEGRKVIEGSEGYHLRDASSHYRALFRAEKHDIAPENIWFWAAGTE